MTIRTHIQAFDLGDEITLYQLDLTPFDLGVLYLAPGTDGASQVSFGGQTYAPHPIIAEGFDLTIDGPLPRPTFTVSNLDNSFTAIVEENDDLQGAVLTRIRTYGRYLDSGAEPDGNAHHPVDVYQLSLKEDHTQEQISWSCTALMDQDGVTLPGRKMIRDFCDHTYRRWTGTSFDYTNVTCPYVDTEAFDEDDVATTSALDRCSKTLRGCRLRFGEFAVLPTGAFPGLARLRVR